VKRFALAIQTALRDARRYEAWILGGLVVASLVVAVVQAIRLRAAKDDG